MRIGVFGGTFDPVHLGHLILAEQCREQARLDEVRFVPAARPPHKADRLLTPFAHRVEMLTLAIAGHAAFRVESLEADRPGPSFTVETLEELRQREPSAEWFLILGADCLPDLPFWREPVRLTQLATLLTVGRPGWSSFTLEQLRTGLRLPPNAPLKQQSIQAPLIDISSRDLRRRVSEHHTIRYLVPRAVECYIETHRLYQSPKPESPSP